MGPFLHNHKGLILSNLTELFDLKLYFPRDNTLSSCSFECNILHSFCSGPRNEKENGEGAKKKTRDFLPRQRNRTCVTEREDERESEDEREREKENLRSSDRV